MVAGDVRHLIEGLSEQEAQLRSGDVAGLVKRRKFERQVIHTSKEIRMIVYTKLNKPRTIPQSLHLISIESFFFMRSGVRKDFRQKLIPIRGVAAVQATVN